MTSDSIVSTYALAPDVDVHRAGQEVLLRTAAGQTRIEGIAEIDALDLLCRSGRWRPAYALLRGLLETAATIIWLARSNVETVQRFVHGPHKGGQAVFRNIGWGDEYEDTFRYLSDLAHPSSIGADAYRWYG